MLKKFVVYCSVLIIMLAFANRNGYVFTSMFTGSQKADKTANHYHK